MTSPRSPRLGLRSAKRPCGGCSTFHDGVDFNPGNGTPVMSIADGVVVLATENGGGLGVNVEVQHNIGRRAHHELVRAHAVRLARRLGRPAGHRRPADRPRRHDRSVDRPAPAPRDVRRRRRAIRRLRLALSSATSVDRGGSGGLSRRLDPSASPAAERGLALLEERGDALAHVVGAERVAEALDLELARRLGRRARSRRRARAWRGRRPARRSAPTRSSVSRAPASSDSRSGNRRTTSPISTASSMPMRRPV